MATPNLLSITNVNGKPLASAQMASGDNTVYTCPSNTSVKLTKFVLVNTTGSAVTVKASRVLSGGSVDSTHQILPTMSLAANDSTVVTEAEGMWLSPGDFISVNAGTAASVDASLDGLVLS